jgi:hypothetical protein
MLTRFLPEINAINQAILAFNKYLSPTYQLPEFDLDRMIEDKNCIEIKHRNWDAFGFPNSRKRGVYFVFGHEKTNETKNGLYIGKASFGSAIGKRLYAHLIHYKDSEFFEMNGYHNEKYILDYMASVELDSRNIVFLATALEEYLISELRNSLNLLNGTGN